MQTERVTFPAFFLTMKTSGRVERKNITTEYRFCSDKAFCA